MNSTTDSKSQKSKSHQSKLQAPLYHTTIGGKIVCNAHLLLNAARCDFDGCELKSLELNALKIQQELNYSETQHMAIRANNLERVLAKQLNSPPPFLDEACIEHTLLKVASSKQFLLEYRRRSGALNNYVRVFTPSRQQSENYNNAVNSKLSSKKSISLDSFVTTLEQRPANDPVLHYYQWAKLNLSPEWLQAYAMPYIRALSLNKKANVFNFLPVNSLDVAAQKQNCHKFPRFNELPSEIRSQIWDYALDFEKRFVEVQFITNIRGKNIPNPFLRSCKTPNNRVPPLLLVNQQSHDLAVKRYELTIHCSRNPAAKSHSYFNYANDTLFFRTEYANELPLIVRCIRPSDLERIQRIALPFRDFQKGHIHKICQAMFYFRNLKSVMLVAGDGRADSAPIVFDERRSKRFRNTFECHWDIMMEKKRKRKVKDLKKMATPEAIRQAKHLERMEKGLAKEAKGNIPAFTFKVIDAMRAHEYRIDELDSSW